MRPTRIAAVIAAAVFAGAPLSRASAAPAARAPLYPFVGYASPNQTVKLLVHLPLRNREEAIALSRTMATPGSAVYHKWLTGPQFAARYGPLRSDMLAAASSLRAGGFTLTGTDLSFIHASAPVATVERYFGTKMGLVRDGNIVHVDARTPFTLPTALSRLGATVIGLQALPQLHADHLITGKLPVLQPQAHYGTMGPYYPGELLQAYGESAYTYGNGAGLRIGIVGYSDSTDAENHTLWCNEGLGPGCVGGSAPYPSVTHYEFPGSIPPDSTGGLAGFSQEAALDAQMAGGSAPGAVIDQLAADAISNFGFLDAYSLIVNYNTGAGLDDIVSTSYSECELDFVHGRAPMYYLQALDDTFAQGAAEGITFLFSSGDNGAYGCYYESSGPDQNAIATSSLAADPNVMGIGGTTAFITTDFDSHLGTGYGSETSHSYASGSTKWGSGGGQSQLFATPGFQTAIGLPGGSYPSGGRQVPDISMHMGGPGPGMTADVLVWNGVLYSVTGTSASCPEFAGFLAKATTAIEHAIGNPGGFRLGNANNIFYYLQATHAPVYQQMIPGDNLVTTYNPFVSPGPGYNQVIGLGTPIYSAIFSTVGLSGLVTAGDLTTASNP